MAKSKPNAKDARRSDGAKSGGRRNPNIREVPPKRQHNGVWRFIIIVGVAAIAVFIFANINTTAGNVLFDNISDFFDRSDDSGYPVSLDGVNIISAEKLGGGCVVLTDTSILGYSPSGKEWFNRQHGFASPRISSAAGTCLVYDSGGHGIRVETRGRTVHEETFDDSIIAADISECGAYIVMTQSQGYKAELTVFDENFSQRSFKWYSARQYVVDAAISPNGKYVAVATVSADNGELVSGVILLDTELSDPVAKLDYPDNMMLSVDFKGNGDIIAVGDKLCSHIPTSDANLHLEYEYDGATLDAYDNSDSSGAALALTRYGNSSSGTVVALDSAGKVMYESEQNSAVRSVAMNKGQVATLTYTEIESRASNGTVKATWEAGADLSLLCYNGDIIAVGAQTYKVN